MKAGTTSGIRLCRPSRTITTTTTRTTTGSSKRTENLRYLLKDFDTNIPTFFGRKFKQFAKQGTSVERRLPSRMLQWLRHLLPQPLHQPDVHGVPNLPSSKTRKVRSFNYLWFTIQFSHFSHVRQCSHIRKMSCAEFYFISRKKHAGVYEKRYSMESFVSVILRMFVYFHYDNQQICSHFLPFPIIPGSQYRWNKTWKKYI